MTKLEDQISSARTLRHVTIVMFVLAQFLSLIHPYKLIEMSESPFRYMAYGMAAFVAVPYLVSRRALKVLGGLKVDVSDASAQAALSQQISTAANMAYVLLFLAFGMLDLTKGWRG